MGRELVRILVADDDAENGKFLQESLGTEECKVVWYRDPRQALSQFEKGKFHVGILDLKMPHINGVELFHRLREKDPDISLIILTGYPSVESALATLKKGAYDYLKKPYKIAELRLLIARILEEKGLALDLDAMLSQKIGSRIKEFRLQRKLTIAELGAKTDLSKSLISQIENAKNYPSLQSLYRIARQLNVKLADLVENL